MLRDKGRDKGLTAAIVGGGIGGLAAAAALTRAGIDVSVYEQSPALGEIGAGVLIGPNSVRLLHRLGLAGAVDEAGGWVGEGSTYYRHDGTRVAPVMTTDSGGWAAMYGMHRADLIDVLRRAVPGERVHAGHRAVSFEQDFAPRGLRGLRHPGDAPAAGGRLDLLVGTV